LKLVLAPPGGGSLNLAVAHRKQVFKSHAMGDWAAPTVAQFPDEESRDGFLRSVAASEDSSWEVKAVPEDGRVAWVRWRAGHFLSLNDIAYSQHGRIKVEIVRRTG
jgi:hypothetical protein